MELTLSPRLMQDPHVIALMAKIQAAKTNAEMLEYILQVQNIVEADGSALADPQRADELNRARHNAQERDAAEQAFERDRVGFVSGLLSDAEKLKLTGDKADQAKANVGKMLGEAITQVRAQNTTKHMRLQHELQHGPKETISVTGNWQTFKVGDASKPRLMPDVISIMGFRYELAPGMQTVPRVIAEAYRNLQHSRQETDERKKLLTSTSGMNFGLEAGRLEAAQRLLDEKYKVGRDTPG